MDSFDKFISSNDYDFFDPKELAEMYLFICSFDNMLEYFSDKRGKYEMILGYLILNNVTKIMDYLMMNTISLVEDIFFDSKSPK
jgi:hypothetical protein